MSFGIKMASNADLSKSYGESPYVLREMIGQETERHPLKQSTKVLFMLRNSNRLQLTLEWSLCCFAPSFHLCASNERGGSHLLLKNISPVARFPDSRPIIGRARLHICCLLTQEGAAGGKKNITRCIQANKLSEDARAL